MNKNSYSFFLIAFLLLACSPSTKEAMSLEDQIAANFQLASQQYQYMSSLLPSDRFPKTFEDGELKTSGSGWWCSGFYPGSLLYLYDNSKDQALLEEARSILGVLAKEQYNTHTHDLGFMMYCSFGNALEIAPQPGYDTVLINSAKSLATRFNEQVGAIKSWDSKEEDFLVIIDNMMNLELLFWATQNTGDSTYYNIAITHANTTIENHFREDFSTYHVLNYDPLSGDIQEKKTAQGYADESAWARGQSWGLYGFTVMYRFTKDEQYLDQAKKIANFLLSHPNLPEDKIPYWDYDAPDIPNAKRDASAAAILASALLELREYDPENSGKYMEVVEMILTTLSSDRYLAQASTNGGFILKHSVGHNPGNSEVDVPLTYADYYFIEAMRRYLTK